MFNKRKNKQEQPAQERPSLVIGFFTLVVVALIMNYHIQAPKLSNTNASAIYTSLKVESAPDSVIVNVVNNNNKIPHKVTGLSNTLPFVRPIPSSADKLQAKHNVRSSQLMPYEARQLYDLGEITTVIRLNGTGKDSGGVAVEEERRLCEAYGLLFLEINLSREENPEQLIHQYLMEGGVHIHCLHGFDRTGGMIAYHLKQLGYSKSYVVAHNRWKTYLRDKGDKYYRYYKFVEG